MQILTKHFSNAATAFLTLRYSSDFVFVFFWLNVVSRELWNSCICTRQLCLYRSVNGDMLAFQWGCYCFLPKSQLTFFKSSSWNLLCILTNEHPSVYRLMFLHVFMLDCQFSLSTFDTLKTRLRRCATHKEGNAKKIQKPGGVLEVSSLSYTSYALAASWARDNISAIQHAQTYLTIQHDACSASLINMSYQFPCNVCDVQLLLR